MQINDQLLDSFTLRSRVPSLEWQAWRPAGGVQTIVLTGKPGTTYILEHSADLVSWKPIATNAVPATPSRAFVRARAVP